MTWQTAHCALHELLVRSSIYGRVHHQTGTGCDETLKQKQCHKQLRSNIYGRVLHQTGTGCEETLKQKQGHQTISLTTRIIIWSFM